MKVAATHVLADDGLHHAFPHVAKMSDGRLLAVWRCGSGHLSPGGTLRSSMSADAGRSWSPSSEVLRAPHDARDPCLTPLSDGRVALSWFDLDGRRSTGVRVAFSEDNGETFPQVADLPHVWELWTAVSAPVVEMPGRALLLPVYGRHDSHRTDAALVASTDGGLTWEVRSRIATGEELQDGLTEPWVVLHSDGQLTCLLRTESGVLRRSVSVDEGRTWSRAETAFRSSSRAPWLQFGDDRSVAMHRSVTSRAAVVRTSTDHWVTWSDETPIDTEGTNTYAGMVELPSHQLCAVWSMESQDGRVGRVVAGILTD
jgi:hypothetical protein